MEELKKQFSDKALKDFELIDRALNKQDETAFAELMSIYQKSVYHTILKMVRNVDDAEDLTMEAFAKAFKNLSKYRKDYSFSTGLFRIATNHTIDFIRKKKLDTMSINSTFSNDNGEAVDMDITDKRLTPVEAAIKSEKIEMVQMFVSKLPAKYQRLVRLRYFKEYSYDEIAQELDVPLGTIKAQLHRARELMYELVKNSKSHF